MSTGRRLPPNACSWCADPRHDGPCGRDGCPCAYRKPTDPRKDA